MTEPTWTGAGMPDQRGRTAVITGANTGLGFATAQVLAQRGASVVLACRTPAKADEAADRIRAAAPQAAVSTLALDLASQASIREAADRLRNEHDRIDLLVNNAGVFGSRQRRVTEDGFEATFGTNHLGVFAFTGLVLDRLLPVAGSRVVSVSSQAHRNAALDVEDLQSEGRYRRLNVYGKSKLANLLFTYELQRRLSVSGASTIAVAAHPGQSRTEFTRDLSPALRFVYGPRMQWLTGWMMQDRALGVLTTLRAAVDPQVQGGDFYGPRGLLQLTGHPVRVTSSARSHDPTMQRQLWDASVALTGVSYPLATAAPDVA